MPILSLKHLAFAHGHGLRHIILLGQISFADYPAPDIIRTPPNFAIGLGHLYTRLLLIIVVVHYVDAS